MKKEEKKITYNLSCEKCKYNFTMELDEPKGFCPKCGKKATILGQRPSEEVDIEKRRNANEEASAMALKLAAEQALKDRIEGRTPEMVPITSTQKGRNYGKSELIPKSVLESIEKKVAPELEDNESEE